MIQQTLGLCRVDLFASRLNHQLEARPLCPGNQCSPVELEESGRIHDSTLLPNWEMPAEDPAGTEYHHNSSPTVALTGMVSNVDGMLRGAYL